MSPAQEDALDLLGSPVRRRIVDTLANLPSVAEDGALRPADGLTAQDLAEHLGLHVSTVRFHLDQLVAAGLLRTLSRRQDGAGRPAKLYAVDHGSLEGVAVEASHELLAGLLVQTFAGQQLGQQQSPEEAGRRWSIERAARVGGHAGDHGPARTAGQWLGKIGQMVDLLREWGYTPEVATMNNGRTAHVALYDCPFLPLARTHTAVVCGIHRGLIKGAMESVGEQSTHVGLQPLVGPRQCVAALTATTPFHSTPLAPEEQP
ncbi:MAG TPA: helix-turn-helix domain-containing protein [Dermatophilaceae bacterium]|nr:helix-turn-helix domain-containing protein [Dermatophilaceae bacterium]